MTETDTVLACPSCDSHQIHYHNPDGNFYTDNGGGWWCKNCHEHHEKPIRRPQHNDGGSVNGLPKQLLEMDPDDVPAFNE